MRHLLIEAQAPEPAACHVRARLLHQLPLAATPDKWPIRRARSRSSIEARPVSLSLFLNRSRTNSKLMCSSINRSRCALGT
jgi:hypothetical protein